MAVVGSRGFHGPSVEEVAVSIALPVRSHPPVAWGAVCRSIKRPSSAFPTIAEFMATPVAIRLGAPSFTSAEEKCLGGRLGLQQRAVGSRPVSGCTERDVEIGAGAILPLLATELSEKSPLLGPGVLLYCLLQPEEGSTL